jgi:hypothetical protein
MGGELCLSGTATFAANRQEMHFDTAARTKSKFIIFVISMT